MSVAIFSGGTSLLRFFSYASNATARFHSCRPIARSSSGVNGISATFRKKPDVRVTTERGLLRKLRQLVLELLLKFFECIRGAISRGV